MNRMLLRESEVYNFYHSYFLGDQNVHFSSASRRSAELGAKPAESVPMNETLNLGSGSWDPRTVHTLLVQF